MQYLEKFLLLLKFLSPIFYILNTFKNSVFFSLSRSLVQVIILMLLVVKFLINFQICDLRTLSHYTFNILEHQSLWFFSMNMLQIFAIFLWISCWVLNWTVTRCTAYENVTCHLLAFSSVPEETYRGQRSQLLLFQLILLDSTYLKITWSFVISLHFGKLDQA